MCVQQCIQEDTDGIRSVSVENEPPLDVLPVENVAISPIVAASLDQTTTRTESSTNPSTCGVSVFYINLDSLLTS